MSQFIDKTQLNVNRTTNATGLLSAIGAIGAAIDGIAEGRPIGAWLPMVVIGGGGAIAQWLQGIPTPTTKLIASVLHLDESRTNAEMLRNVFRRVISTGVVPGLEQGSVMNAAADVVQVDAVDTPRSAARLPVSSPENISMAWDEARRLKREFGLPQIPSAELDMWRNFNESGDDDGDNGPRSEAY